MVPARKRLSLPLFGALVIAALVLGCAFLGVTGLGIRLLNNYSPIRTEGQEGHIVTGAPSAIVVRDVASFDAAANASVAQLQQMQASGKLFLVPEGTRIKVLSADARRYQVQVLDGDFAGAVGFVPAAFVQR